MGEAKRKRQEGPVLPPLQGMGPAEAFAAQRPEQRLGDAPVEARYSQSMIELRA
jgi:hypothetical protein